MKIPSQKYVDSFYSEFRGRIPLVAGVAHDVHGGAPYNVYPFVLEIPAGTPTGAVAMAPNPDLGETSVQVYFLSAFLPKQGHGSKVLARLCAKADELKVDLHVQAEPRYADDEDFIPPPDKLIEWYRRFGFEGSYFMVRRNAA